MIFGMALPILAQDRPFGIGRLASAEEIAKLNLTVYPDGRGLPRGGGNAQRGASVYKEKCAVCHNDKGEGREAQYPALVGGRGTLASDKPKKTVGSFWPYATTVFDYIRRSMPFDDPSSLSTEDVYSLTAFILYLNGIVGEIQELNEKNLAAVVMPNRYGFVRHTESIIPRRHQ